MVDPTVYALKSCVPRCLFNCVKIKVLKAVQVQVDQLFELSVGTQVRGLDVGDRYRMQFDLRTQKARLPHTRHGRLKMKHMHLNPDLYK